MNNTVIVCLQEISAIQSFSVLTLISLLREVRPLHYDYRSSTVSVKIIVEDINDNFPLFGQPFYTVTITEAAVVNTTLLKVQVRR